MAETTNQTVKKPNVFARIKKYLKETKAEMKKVSWPSKEQLTHNTLIILIFIAIVAVILSVLDIGFAKLIGLLTQLFRA